MKKHLKKSEVVKWFNSPFKRPKLIFYLGKVKFGTPYFLPRRMVKMSWETAIKKSVDSGFKHPPSYYRKRYCEPKPKRIGFDIVRLGYKYKFGSLRFEWNPMISIVFFGLQFCIKVKPEHESQYWESWVYYHKHTDKTKSTRERIEQCREEAPQTWVSSRDGRIDYFNLILRDKWKTKK